MTVRELTTAPADAGRQLGPVLVLAPSRGLGGGIERYVATVESAFADHGVDCRRLDLPRPGPAGHRSLLSEAGAVLDSLGNRARLVLAHRALLPVGMLLAQRGRTSGISVICHGSDVWGMCSGPRWQVESWLMRRPVVRVVAVSSFTAGALLLRGAGGHGTPATILPPGLSRRWYSELADAREATQKPRPGPGREVVTAFRLADWRDKGLPVLTGALGSLGRTDVRLTVCGSGEPPADLIAHVARYPWCRLRPGLTDRELAAQLARSDLLVLASRTRTGRRPAGEGFGLVLLEAQVAGTAVVGPAHGGSPDAYLDGVTGMTPRDESTAALAGVLATILRDPVHLAAMGDRGAAWAQAGFAPDRYAALAVDRLL